MLPKKMPRVILGLKKNSDYVIPKFSECIVDFFTKDSNSVNVSPVLEGNTLLLELDKNGYKLQHSPECPIKILSQKVKNDSNGMDDIKPAKKMLNVSVAVSIIVESLDHHVLLTKRQSHMRSSPRVWVPPGGHLEPGESLYDGGIREVKEETGLNISNGKSNILCLWENVYPLLLGFGSPTNHVLVVYYHVQMNETHQQLQKKIVLDPDEVESSCWLSAFTVLELFQKSETNRKHKKYVLENGEMVEKDLDANNMFNKFLWLRKEPYSGTQYALKTWVEVIAKNNNWFSKF